MGLLFASFIALALGPVLLRLAGVSPSVLRGLDGFIYVAVAGLVLLYLLPDAIQLAGWWALGAVVLGMIGPTLVERRLKGAARLAHQAALGLACLAFGGHALFEGAALAATSGSGVLSGIGLAIVLHRVPEGLTLWWLVAPAHGPRIAGAVLAAVLAMTGVGYFAAGAVDQLLHLPSTGLLVALVGGSLLHVVLHRPHPIAAAIEAGLGRYAAGVGALGGVLLLVGLRFRHGAGGHADHGTSEHVEAPTTVAGHGAGFGDTLLDLFLESAPALVFAYLAAGLVQAWLPKASIRWLGKGSSLAQASRGVAFGLPLPICSCGVVPVYRSLVVQGAPPAAAMAFLVATPELGLDAVILSIPLLGGGMTAARVAAAVLVALLIGWLVGSRAEVRPEAVTGIDTGAFDRPSGAGARFALALRAGFIDVVDHTAPWILVGLVVAAAASPAIAALNPAVIPDVLEVGVFALLGIPVYVCASGATPLVAILLAEGVSPGAGVAFLIAGPATNVTTFGILSGMHGRRTAIAFGAWIAGLCIALGCVLNLGWPDLGGNAFAAGEHHTHGPIAWSALVIFCLLCVFSLLRRGPREFFSSVFAQGAEPPAALVDGAAAGDEEGGCCAAPPEPEPEPDPPQSGGSCCPG